MFEYIGNLHIHSSYSDGSKDIKQIACDAARAGLDFIIVTDYNQLTALQKGQEKYYDDVLVLVGSEINKEKNHYH
ncbi:MAG: PHP domain-containing protein [Bacillota bacterium]|nr:PHP domain-containing protein [Bacillota bacterium]